MNIKSNVRWSIYLLLITVNTLLLEYYVVGYQHGSDIGDDLYGGVAIYFNENKPKELTGYLVGAALIFFIYIINVVLRSRKYSANILRPLVRASDSLRFQWDNAIHYAHMIVLPIFVISTINDGKVRAFIQLYVVLYTLLNMYGSTVVGFMNKAAFLRAIALPVAMLTMMLLVGQVAYVFSNHIWGRPKIINEFYNIPESSKVGDSYVDNSTYMNKHFLNGVSNKWDIEKADVQGNYINIALGEHDIMNPASKDSLLYYNNHDSRLYLNGVFKLQDLKWYGSEKLYAINDENKLKQYVIGVKKIKYDDQEKKFIQDNLYEFHWQILDRYMIHHHGFILNPASDMDIGKPYTSLKAQYGIGNILVFTSLMKTIGGISIENWLKLNGLFYVVYYLIYALILLSVFDNKLAAVVIFVLSIYLLNLHEYQFLILAPGDSPWRNFFDIPIFYALHKYQTSNMSKYAILALLMGVSSVFINPDIGMMIYIALIVSMIVYSYIRFDFKPGLIFMILLSIIVSAYLFSHFSSKGDLTEYYLKGVIGFPISNEAVVKIVSILIAGYAILLYDLKNKRFAQYLLLLYLFIYAQGLVLYYVWHADRNGLLARSHIYVLTLSMFLYDVWGPVRRDWKWKHSAYGSVIILSFIIYMNSVSKVLRGKSQYEQIFKNHKIYNWEFDRAKIESTVDPVYFSEAISLIYKYNGVSPLICIISKYDNILPFLAHKSSIMPFHDLKWYNITDKELQKSIDKIKTLQPEYIYVDSDINRNYNNDIVPASLSNFGYLHEESVWRAERLKLMAKIFYDVSDRYQLIESGRLMSVYKKIPRCGR